MARLLLGAQSMAKRLVVLCLFPVLIVCGAEPEGGDPGGGDADADSDSDTDSDSDADTGGSQGPEVPPPEIETPAGFRTPQSGRRYVYVANTKRDSIAVIDSETLNIEIVQVGDAPFLLAAIPGQEATVVLYERSAELGVVRTEDGRSRVTHLQVEPGSNRIEVAPDGQHAVVFFDPDRAIDPDASEGSYQDITVVRLTDRPEAIRLTVGFHPNEVLFADGGRQALVVTEDGLHPIVLEDVTGPAIAPTADIGPPPEWPSAREVVVTDDGDLALVRTAGSTEILVVEIATGRQALVHLSSEPTDLDVSAGGREAIAVLRDASAVVLLELPAVLDDPTRVRRIDIEGELFGQAVRAADGERILLFTTAVPQERLVVLDPASGSWSAIRLRKTVRTVGVAPQGHTAVVIHGRLEGDPATAANLDERIDRQFGYSMVDLDSGFVRLQTTEVDPGPFLIDEDGRRAVLAMRDDVAGVREVESVDLSAFQVETIRVPSPPTALGAVPDTGRIYVAQEHLSGRITFIEVETLESQTVTGFELGAEVVE